MSRTLQFIQGDCIDLMGQMADQSLEGILGDPPYGISFMGRKWDSFANYHRNEILAEDELDLHDPEWEDSDTLWSENDILLVGSSLSEEEEVGSAFMKRAHEDLSAPQKMQLFHEYWLTEAFRILQEGRPCLAFSAGRTFHRLVAAYLRVGFEKVEMTPWCYGSGFPKSMNIAKAFDKTAGYSIKEPYSPRTDMAKAFSGYGTALKPAFEPIIIGYKPTGTPK